MTLLLTLVYFGLRSELFKIRANKDLKYTENVRYGKKATCVEWYFKGKVSSHPDVSGVQRSC